MKGGLIRNFGMAGMFEQDDMENWGDITRSLSGTMARGLWLQYNMGMEVTPAKVWKGAGKAYSQPLPMDLNERIFYERWKKLMTRS